MKPIKLAIVDDDQLIAKLLHDYLNEQAGTTVQFIALSGANCLSKLEQTKPLPDIIILDLNMKEMTGVDLTKIIKRDYPSIKVIVISSHYKRNFTGFMVKTGVAAFLPKGISPIHLLAIIQEVYTKDIYFLEDQLEVIRKQLSAKTPKPVLNVQKMLSEREIEVLKLICQQKTAQEIGKELHVTKRTVEGHKNNLFAKTGTKNMAGLVIFAIQNEIIKLKDLPNL
ncbi:MAG: response regulator transcription factor [Bacteroidota bacterium]